MLKRSLKKLSRFSNLVRLLKNIILFTTSNIRNLLNFYDERLIYIFLQSLRNASFTNKDSKLLTEFKVYPKIPRRIFPIESNIRDLSIILQGPILDREFVQNSINWYSSCGVRQIVVSTNDQVKDFINADTIVSKKSSISGLGNENNHIKTTKAGLNLIDDDKIVIKTRSDQRIFNELAISAIPFMHKKEKSELTIDGSRLGVISNNSMLMKINNISDHLYIGKASLMKKMFSLNYRFGKEILDYFPKDFPDLYKRDDGTWLLRSTKDTCRYTEFFGEQWIFNSFRKNCLKNDFSEAKIVKNSFYREALKNYLKIIKTCLYVIDPDELELYWIKSNIYTLPSFYHNKYQNKKAIPCMRLTRLNWLSLICDPEYENKILNYSDKLKTNESLF